MATNKLDRIERDIEKTKTKIAELQKQLRSRSCKSSFGSWKRQRPNRKICRSSSLCAA